MIRTIPNRPNIRKIEYHPPFSVICSVGKAPFHGTLDIEFEPGETLLEFESFENWLRELATSEMTIEDLARLVFDELSAVLGDVPLSVIARAQTTVHAPVSAIVERE